VEKKFDIALLNKFKNFALQIQNIEWKDYDFERFR